jgi:hypothetical protein
VPFTTLDLASRSLYISLHRRHPCPIHTIRTKNHLTSFTYSRSWTESELRAERVAEYALHQLSLPQERNADSNRAALVPNIESSTGVWTLLLLHSIVIKSRVSLQSGRHSFHIYPTGSEYLRPSVLSPPPSKSPYPPVRLHQHNPSGHHSFAMTESSPRAIIGVTAFYMCSALVMIMT